MRRAAAELERQQQRLLDAYVAGVIDLPAFERKRQELTRRQEHLAMQQRQLDAIAQQQLELGTLAAGAEAFCAQAHAGLATATFERLRTLVELLIDRVLVTDGEVEIRYVIPTSRDGPHQRFCQLRKA